MQVHSVNTMGRDRCFTLPCKAQNVLLARLHRVCTMLRTASRVRSESGAALAASLILNRHAIC